MSQTGSWHSPFKINVPADSNESCGHWFHNRLPDIPDVPYHRFAELIGLKGIFVDRPDALGGAWDEALGADRPVVLEVKTDPEVPPCRLTSP
jgi:thiamine pyrophosphate-dependent acetolactate synthase large subunit-like protein